MIRLIAALCLIACNAFAQNGSAAVVVPSPCGQGDLDPTCHIIANAPALAAMAAQIPQPLPTIPPGGTPSGAPGTPGYYVPGNAAPPSLARGTTVTTGSNGTFSITWNVPFQNSNPIILFSPQNASAQPAMCNWITRSASSLTAQCWLFNTVTVAGITVSVATGNASNMTVGVLAREPTQ